MALPQRHLIARLIPAVLALLLCSSGHLAAAGDGTPAANSPRQFRGLAAGNPVPLAGLRYELKGKTVPLHFSDVSFSPLYEAPSTDPLVLFREIPPVPPETTPKRIPVLSINLGSSPLVLLAVKASTPNSLTARVFDDSWGAFPSQTVRVISLSRHKIAAQVEGTSAELPPSGTHLFPYSSAKPRIRIKVASLNDDVWKLQFNNSQAILPGYRVNMVVVDFERSARDPDPEGIHVFKMLDPLPPPDPGLAQK